MSQTIKFARTRTVADPDRTNTHVGQFYGINRARHIRKGDGLTRRVQMTYSKLFTEATRYGAVVAPTSPVVRVPRSIRRAVISEAIADHTYESPYADREWFQGCDMHPKVTRQGVYDPRSGVLEPGDTYLVEVQYSTKGGRALYGVSRSGRDISLYAD